MLVSSRAVICGGRPVCRSTAFLVLAVAACGEVVKRSRCSRGTVALAICLVRSVSGAVSFGGSSAGVCPMTGRAALPREMEGITTTTGTGHGRLLLMGLEDGCSGADASTVFSDCSGCRCTRGPPLAGSEVVSVSCRGNPSSSSGRRRASTSHANPKVCLRCSTVISSVAAIMARRTSEGLFDVRGTHCRQREEVAISVGLFRLSKRRVEQLIFCHVSCCGVPDRGYCTTHRLAGSVRARTSTRPPICVPTPVFSGVRATAVFLSKRGNSGGRPTLSSCTKVAIF